MDTSPPLDRRGGGGRGAKGARGARRALCTRPAHRVRPTRTRLPHVNMHVHIDMCNIKKMLVCTGCASGPRASLEGCAELHGRARARVRESPSCRHPRCAMAVREWRPAFADSPKEAASVPTCMTQR